MSGKQGASRAPQVLDLPDTVDLAAVNAAEVTLIRMAAQGQIGVREAILFSRLLEHRRRAIGDVTLEETLDRIEEAQKAQFAQQAIERKP